MGVLALSMADQQVFLPIVLCRQPLLSWLLEEGMQAKWFALVSMSWFFSANQELNKAHNGYPAFGLERPMKKTYT